MLCLRTICTPDECSRKKTAGDHDNEAFLDGVNAAGKQKEEPSFVFGGGGTSKQIWSVHSTLGCFWRQAVCPSVWTSPKIVQQRRSLLSALKKKVYGVLEIVNINTVLMQLVCTECKSTKVRRTVDGGGYYFACNSVVQVVEILKLDGKITKPDKSFVSVSLVGNVVDKVFDMPIPFKDMYARNVHDAREELACFRKADTFILSHIGRIVSFVADSSASF